MQRGVRFFQKLCFPCSVAWLLGRGGGARRAPGELPCSVAFVSFQNFASHAAWRGFWAAGGGARRAPGELPCSVAFVSFKNFA